MLVVNITDSIVNESLVTICISMFITNFRNTNYAHNKNSSIPGVGDCVGETVDDDVDNDVDDSEGANSTEGKGKCVCVCVCVCVCYLLML